MKVRHTQMMNSVDDALPGNRRRGGARLARVARLVVGGVVLSGCLSAGAASLEPAGPLAGVRPVLLMLLPPAVGLLAAACGFWVGRRRSRPVRPRLRVERPTECRMARRMMVPALRAGECEGSAAAWLVEPNGCEGGRVRLGVVVVEEGAVVDGRLILQLLLGSRYALRAVALWRGDRYIADPPVVFRLQSGDRVVLAGRRGDLRRVRPLFRTSPSPTC